MIPDKGQMSQFEWRPHTTHHDDCGCLRRDLEAKLEIAREALEKIKDLEHYQEGVGLPFGPIRTTCDAEKIAKDTLTKIGGGS